MPVRLHSVILRVGFSLWLAGACLPAAAGTAPRAAWVAIARRLTGESDEVRRQAIARLEAIEDLEERLRGALAGPDRYLALDTIASLGMRELVPDLYSLSESDDEGAVYLAIDAFLDEGNAAAIADLYEHRLDPIARRKVSVPAQIVMLDTLARLGDELPLGQVKELMESRSSDLRSAALYYARHFLVRGETRYLPLLELAASMDGPYQLRRQLLAILDDLPEAIGANTRGSLGACAEESDEGSGIFSEPREIASSPPMPAELPWLLLGDPRCRSAYRGVYERPTVEIRVVFGYKDARPARLVDDRYQALALKARLRAPCRAGSDACGFLQDSSDAELLWREVPGPDGLPRTVRVRVIFSAAGPDDDENRVDSFQKWRSRHAKAAFLDGLRDAEIVFYDGHSRDGGGPDFAPPLLTLDKHVDYAWYSANRPGAGQMLQALNAPGRTRLLGFFSCISDRFVPEVEARRPGLATISSPRLLFYADALKDLMGAISSLVGMRCHPDFDSAIEAESVGGHTHFRRFFGRGA